jgi:hypothetical protein
VPEQIESGSGVPEKYLKLVGEEPTPVMPDEMENLVKESCRAIRKLSSFSKESATNV